MADRDERLEDLRRRTAQTAAERARLLRERAEHRRQLDDLDAQIRDAATHGEALKSAREAAAHRRRISIQDLRVIEENLRLLEEEDVDPCDVSSAEPLLLLPIRLETRFRQGEAGTELMIRIFPDTVHIDRLRRPLTDDERKAGALYVKDAASAADETAWTVLRERVGPRRAAWVAERLRAEQQGGQIVVAPQDDPGHDHDGPVARLLPDRFVAVAMQAGERQEAKGALITAPPPMGLFGDEDEEADLEVINGVPVAPGAEWIVDYAAAEAAGLAITLSLPSDAPIETLTVFGVRRGLSASDTALALEQLLDAHRFTDGLSLLPQGTPTNNLDDERSGYASGKVGREPRAAPAPPASDSGRLAAALGIGGAGLAAVDHAAEDGEGLAKAANTVLWQPSWGTFLDALDTTAGGDTYSLTDSDLEQTRRFHRDFVRGRGPLPALRIGKQPYGVLPVATMIGRWRSDGFESRLAPIVERVREVWRKCLDRVPRIGAGKLDEAAVEILGSSPVALGLRARGSTTYLPNGPAQSMDERIVDTDLELEALINKTLFEEIVDGQFSTNFVSLNEQSRPVALPFAHDSDVAVLTKMAHGQPTAGKVKSVLQALCALSLADAIARTKAGTDLAFTDLTDHAPASVKPLAEGYLAVAAEPGAYDAATLHAIGDQLDTALGVKGRLADYQPEPAGRRSFGQLFKVSQDPEAKVEFSGFALPQFFQVLGTEREVRDAILRLAKSTTAERSIVTAETLDTASHRLDAWVTALVEARRLARRKAVPTGLHVGAWGYLENIVPNTEDGEFGYIHAPSAGQAVTAGLLRSAYLAHAGESANGAFAIDLSSARVRDAMDLIDSMRVGQALGEALGYRIERRLHEARLDRVVRNLRRFAPVGAKGLAFGDGDDDQAQENIAGGAVMDGVALVDLYRKGKVGDIVKAAGEPPVDNPYLAGGSWQTLSGDEAGAVEAAIAAAAGVLDAMSDLLLAEGVHQMAQGNMARASAALDAGGTGAAPPPAPTVVATPPGGGALTHRLMICLTTDSGGWNMSQPRAAAEPRLEAWAAGRLGPSSGVVVFASGTLLTLDKLGLCALDVVYGSADPEALELRIRRHFNLAADAPLAIGPTDKFTAGQRALGDVLQAAVGLRTVLSAAQPARPEDLVVPFDSKVRSLDFSAAHGRAAKARTTLAGRLAGLEGAMAAGASLDGPLQALGDCGLMPPSRGSRADVGVLAAAQARQRLAAADAALALPATADSVAAAGKALFGEGFWILPTFAAPATPDNWNAALAGVNSLARPSAIRRWLADFGSVRPAIRGFADSVMLSEALGRTPKLAAIQAASVGAEPPTGPRPWAGLNAPNGMAVSWVLELSGPGIPTQDFAALVTDSFAEHLVDYGQRATAVAFNAPTPSARPPQSWLLALAPTDDNWSTDMLLATIADTVELAKLRGVTFERLKTSARVLPALYQKSQSLQGELVFQFLGGLDVEDGEASLFPAGLTFVKDA